MSKKEGLRSPSLGRQTPKPHQPLSRGHHSKSVTEKIARYCKLKAANDYISGRMLRDAGVFGVNSDKVTKAGYALRSCASWLMFRQYCGSLENRLIDANFCNKHLLCPPCAAARATRLLQRFIPAVVAANQMGMHSYMGTLTWPSSHDLLAGVELGESALKKLWARKKVNSAGPFAHVQGLIVSLEITRSENGWHPHFHCVYTMPKKHRINAAYLRQEWEKLTGGRQIRLDPIREVSDLVEVIKYAVKPLDLVNDKPGARDAVLDRIEAWLTLSGRRFLRSYGIYFGMDKEPDKLTDPELDETEFVDLFYRWFGDTGQYYIVRGGTKRVDTKAGSAGVSYSL